MKSSKTRLFRWALWWGLGIMVVSLAIMVIDEIVSMGDPSSQSIEEPMTDIIYQIIYQFGIWPMVIYIGLLGPITEELSFRLWGNGKKWTGYTSVVVMSLWVLAIAKWLAPIVLIAGVAVMVVFDSDRNKRLFALMLLSTTLFALVHIGNYNPNQAIAMFIVALLHKFGMGLLASYLVINHNILWSMGLHILNNGILAILLGIGFEKVADTTTVIKNDDYCITIKPVLTKSQDKSGYYCGWINDSVFYDIGSPDFTTELFIMFDNRYSTPVVSGNKFYPKVEMKIEMLGGSTDYDAVARTLEKEGWIALDTVGDTIHVRNAFNPLENM